MISRNYCVGDEQLRYISGTYCIVRYRGLADFRQVYEVFRKNTQYRFCHGSVEESRQLKDLYVHANRGFRLEKIVK